MNGELFSDESIDAEVAAFNRELEALLASVPATHDVEPEVTRAMRESGEGLFGPIPRAEAAEDRLVPGADVPIRVLVPETVRGVYLHIHGGGWVLGAPHHSDMQNWDLACRCQLAVVSVGYRLAPEHPYPAAPDDCESVARWLLDRMGSEFGTENLYIGGESAGAHLSVVTLLRLRDKYGFTSVRAANLVYGCFDLGLTPSARNWGERQLILSTPTIDWFVSNFLGEHSLKDTDVSPLLADLSSLPPALFSVGTLDPLIDDSLFMSQRWAAAGNKAELAIYPGGIHGFDMFDHLPITGQARSRMHDFLAGH